MQRCQQHPRTTRVVRRMSRQLGVLLVFLDNRIWISMLLVRELFCIRSTVIPAHP